ncbi:hypothetical protein GCM10009722_21440 [Williamsia deligens]
MGLQPLQDELETTLRLELVAGSAETAMQPTQPVPECRVADVRCVDGLSDAVQQVRLEIDDPLAEPGCGDRAPVVRDVRRQQRHARTHRGVVRAGHVVPDRAGIDDQQRPRIMCVGRVVVVDESGVEDFDDAVDAGIPGAHLRLHDHITNVQDLGVRR